MGDQSRPARPRLNTSMNLSAISWGLSEASSQEEISMWSRRVPAVENLAGWRLNVTYRSKTTDFVIVEFGR